MKLIHKEKKLPQKRSYFDKKDDPLLMFLCEPSKQEIRFDEHLV